ncbi:hypothetical protein QBC47DRAFT_63296 [Echria macrotheca]|uniref:Uncharacterized protein n=1 Tax=Echria macrotheca TaxID=438768 RepID=A0AAJ0F642_9PEZI|nr:hypothetical protein QBC47DRAFT_63296 [Echria macrotheca]
MVIFAKDKRERKRTGSEEEDSTRASSIASSIANSSSRRQPPVDAGGEGSRPTRPQVPLPRPGTSRGIGNSLISNSSSTTEYLNSDPFPPFYGPLTPGFSPSRNSNELQPSIVAGHNWSLPTVQPDRSGPVGFAGVGNYVSTTLGGPNLTWQEHVEAAQHQWLEQTASQHQPPALEPGNYPAPFDPFQSYGVGSWAGGPEEAFTSAGVQLEEYGEYGVEIPGEEEEEGAPTAEPSPWRGIDRRQR